MNIYFWIYIIAPRLAFSGFNQSTVYSIILFALIISLVYFNNLLLVPYFLNKKHYVRYLLLILPAIYIIAWCYTYILKLALSHNPLLQPGDITLLISERVTRNTSVISVFSEMWGYFWGLPVVVSVFTLAWFTRDYFKQQRISAELKKKQLETELQFLKSQMNPHFLFNTLNNIYGLSITNNEQAPGAIMKLSAILRYMLYESDTDKISFEREKEIIMTYTGLELLRLHQKDILDCEMMADGNYSIPPLLWLPVLENLFKHGTRKAGGPVEKVEFRFTIQKNELTIFSKNRLITSANTEGGIGLNNLRHRLEILYPGCYTLHTGVLNNDFIVEAKIRLS